MTELPVVEETAKKSGMLWLALPGLPQPRAAWHLWHGGAVYVLTGGEGEQPLPGLPEIAAAGGTVTVILRSKDKGGRLVSWAAAVTELRPGGPEWDTVVPLLAKDRLNARDHTGQAARWAAESYVFRLSPVEVVEPPDGQPDDYAAVRPVPTPATSSPARPFMIGGRGRAADR